MTSARWAGAGVAVVLASSAEGVSLADHATPAVPQSSSQGPSAEELRAFADGVLDDAIHDRRHALYLKLCKLPFSPSEEDLGRVQSVINAAYGNLLEAKLASQGAGWFAELSGTRHKEWSFEYSARTSKFDFSAGYQASVHVLVAPTICVRTYGIIRNIPVGKLR